MRPLLLASFALSVLFSSSCTQPGSSSTWVRVGEGGSIVNRAGDEWQVRWHEDGVDTLVDVEGEPVLSDDQRDVSGFLGEGSLRVRTRGEGPRRDLLIEPTDEGRELRYSVDGHAAEWDALAAQWLADVLEELVQRTGVGAAARAERILAEGGPMALATEIGRIDPGAAQNAYVERLLQEPRLSKDVLLVALEASPRMSSESTRAFIAARCAPHDPADAALTARLLDVADSISSSSTRTELLETLTVQRTLDPVLRERAIRVAGATAMESLRAAALIRLAPPTADASVEVVWVTVARSISSAATKSETLQTFLARDAISPRGLEAVLGAATTISSESARAATLEAWLARAPADVAARTKWIEAVETISGSSLKGELLTTLLARDDVAAETFSRAAQASAGISAESTRSTLLVEAARVAPPAALDAVLDATATISSSTLRAAPLIALLERPDLEPATLDGIANVIAGISSDATRAEVQALLIERLAR